ncbi:hypothetical protein AIOL_002743 [Candidatus Rhodobacter oscarellae]|uniref:Uncharacterized protein n=1 Tax=Candidatus Rhodobacter oscarellae TaxID=1675527 RepID=A0A0J9E4Q8_9RHOB|nr:hypothetical protein [Candidatus Rhodobacter lobularis]KMW57775.1 hypothetical protein AIOL_002743 [Candidatus Rhodobacter lobularis]
MAGLPDARGKSFATLDDYLAHLAKLGPIDIPYYEPQPDGRYRLIIRQPAGQAPLLFTRAELASKFGFSASE